MSSGTQPPLKTIQWNFTLICFNAKQNKKRRAGRGRAGISEEYFGPALFGEKQAADRGCYYKIRAIKNIGLLL